MCTKTYAASPVACGGSSANYLVSYAYDLDGRLLAVNDNSAAVTAPATTASYTAATTYDAMNRPLQVSWSPAPAQTAPTASTASFSYGYDPTNRRTSANASDNSWWDYPPNTTTTTTAYTANNLNQYSAVGSVSPTYDQNGNLTYDGTFTYGYDTESRLTSIKQGANTVATYAYDAQGRRKSKTVGSATTLFVTDADNREVLEYDGTSGALQRWYAFGQGPDAVLGQMNVAAGTRETMIPDVQGSIVGLLDSGTGALTKSGYQPFGENPTLMSGTFRWTGRRFDPETADSTSQPSGLYYFRARMNSPIWGRFLQPDPIGYAAGANLYAYANNDPLSRLDPFGTCHNPQGCGGILGAVVPGAEASSQAFAQLQRGNYGSAALQFGRALAEAGLAVASVGEGTAALQVGRAAVSGTAEAVGAVTSLFRAVSPAELEDLAANAGAFRNPLGIETKYFSTTSAGAASYARQTFGTGLYQGPHTIVQTSIPASAISPVMRVTVDRGISTIVIPSEMLPHLSPAIPLSVTPLLAGP